MDAELEDMVITDICYTKRHVWKAVYASDDMNMHAIDFQSLDHNFMADAIEKAKRNPGMPVPVPKGRAKQRVESQLSQDPSSGAGPVPGDLYNASAFCQRNAVLMAFSGEVTQAQLTRLMEKTNSAMLDSSFADVISVELGMITIKHHDITTEAEFVAMANSSVAWLFSPVRKDGYSGHSIVIRNGIWYDSAHMNAIASLGVPMVDPDWHAELPYDWALWKCTDVRQLLLPSQHGCGCACGAQISRTSDVQPHVGGKRHKGWLRRMARGNK